MGLCAASVTVHVMTYVGHPIHWTEMNTIVNKIL